MRAGVNDSTVVTMPPESVRSSHRIIPSVAGCSQIREHEVVASEPGVGSSHSVSSQAPNKNASGAATTQQAIIFIFMPSTRCRLSSANFVNRSLED